MDAKVNEWRPGPNVCRCCLTEGCYKDISTEYFWMGKREVYAEMLSETFDLTIAYSKSGGPNSNSRLICENCIARLRDATDFKRQVKECEKTFIQHLDPGNNVSADIELRLEPQDDKTVKLESVKLEKRHSDDDFDDRNDFATTLDDDDDDLDDQPLLKLASKTLKKETENVDILDLLDNAKVTEKRKSSTRSKEPPTKKLKKKEPLPKPSASKNLTTEKKKKGTNTELSGKDGVAKTERLISTARPSFALLRRNAKTLIKYSTACPFKVYRNKFVCSFCDDRFQDPCIFRDHVRTLHENADVDGPLSKIADDYVKIDVVDLKCKLCHKKIEVLETLARHLTKAHNKAVRFDVPLGVLPFRLNSKYYSCVCCDNRFSSFAYLNRHMLESTITHSCPNCGGKFVREGKLRAHLKFSKCLRKEVNVFKGSIARQNAEIILKCSTAFPFRTWLHQINCVFCRGRFVEPSIFRYHMTTKHNNFGARSAFYKKLGKEYLKIDITDLKCKLCSTRIENVELLMEHLKNLHQQPIDLKAQCGVLPYRLDAKDWSCVYCDRKFSDFENLNKHTPEHLQNFVCDSCGKGFITEGALRNHKKIPHENLYHCYRCIETFSTSEERRKHIKAKHKNQPYICNLCENKPRFCSWDARRRHFITVHKIPPKAYECEVCTQTFKSRSTKSDHMRKVHSDRQFPCTQCNAVLYSKTTLDTHVTKKHVEN